MFLMLTSSYGRQGRSPRLDASISIPRRPARLAIRRLSHSPHELLFALLPYFISLASPDSHRRVAKAAHETRRAVEAALLTPHGYSDI